MKKMLLTYLTLMFILSGCTISFSNISTHGTAQDLVDETQTSSPTTTIKASLPVKAV